MAFFILVYFIGSRSPSGAFLIIKRVVRMKMSVELKNYYGFSELVHEFDFSNTGI